MGVVKVWLWCDECAYSERNDKNTNFLFIVSLKTMKREEKGNELPPSFRSHSLLTVLNQVHMETKIESNI